MEPVNNRGLKGPGTGESRWQASRWFEQIPRIDVGGIVAGAKRLVVVAPHPDDEVLGCGGLMRQAHANALDVLVVSVSDGEHCYPGHPYWTPERLRPTRRQELADALAALGLRDPSTVALEMPDGGLCEAADIVAQMLGAQLRSDDLVLVTWERDGHPDHEGASIAARRAAASIGCRFLQYPVWGWHWASPDSPELDALRPLRLDLDAQTRHAKQQAIACFATQTGTCAPGIVDPILPAHVLERFARPFEVFFR